MPHPAARPAQPRNNALAQIHIAKAQLGMDNDTYRAMLLAQASVKSAAELDHAGRAKVLAHLRACGAALGRAAPAYPGKPHAPRQAPADSAAQLRKVEALLADARRPWAYAAAMCKRMFHVDAVEFATPEHLQKLIAALVYDQQRRAKRVAEAAALAEAAANSAGGTSRDEEPA